MFEWQFTHDRPNIRLLLFVVICVVVVERRRMLAWRCGSAGRASACARRACGRSTSRAGRGTSRSSRGPARARTASARASRCDSSCRARSTELPTFSALDVADRAVRVVARRCTTSCLRAPACARPRARSWPPAAGGTSRTAAVSVALHQLALGRLRAVHAVARACRTDCAARARCLPSRRARRGCGTPGTSRSSRAGLICPNFRMCPFASSSTCAWPGPWQLSQPWVAAGERGFFACACGVPLSESRLVGVAREARVAADVAAAAAARGACARECLRTEARWRRRDATADRQPESVLHAHAPTPACDESSATSLTESSIGTIAHAPMLSQESLCADIRHVSPQRHPEIRAFVRGRIRDPLEAHVAAHLVERRPLVLLHPRLDLAADRAQVVRAVAKERRHHLRGVRAGHRRLDDVDAGVDAAGDRQIDALTRPASAAVPRRRSDNSEESDSGSDRTISSSSMSMSAR